MSWDTGITIAFCLGNAFGCCLILLVGEIDGLVRARRAERAAAEAEHVRRLRAEGCDYWRQDAPASRATYTTTTPEGENR